MEDKQIMGVPLRSPVGESCSPVTCSAQLKNPWTVCNYFFIVKYDISRHALNP